MGMGPVGSTDISSCIHITQTGPHLVVNGNPTLTTESQLQIERERDVISHFWSDCPTSI